MTIVMQEDIRDGKPVLEGTRVAVEDIVEGFYTVGRGIDELSDDYSISTEEVEEALRYHKHSSETEITA